MPEKSISENLVQFQKFESVVNEEVRQIFLEYQVDILSESLIKDSFAILKEQLPSEFKWSQMKKIFSPEKIGFDIRDFLKFGYVFSKDPTKKVLTIRLDSTGYKFDNRETLFHRVTIF